MSASETGRSGRRRGDGGLDLRLTRRLASYVLGHKALVGASLAAMLATDPAAGDGPGAGQARHRP